MSKGPQHGIAKSCLTIDALTCHNISLGVEVRVLCEEYGFHRKRRAAAAVHAGELRYRFIALIDVICQ